MVEFGKDDLIVSLKVATTLATGAYTGGAWFLLFGAVPMATSLKASCCLKVAKSIFPRCMPMGATSVLAMLGGGGVYLLSRQSKASESGWLVPACVFAVMQPYTLKLLMPINKRVMNGEVPEQEAHETMDRWWSYHLWRTLAASGTFVFLSYLLARK